MIETTKHPVEELHRIGQFLLDSNESNEIASVLELHNFYDQFLYNHHYDKSDSKDIFLEHGVALSTDNAADCLKDYKRTARFIKGVHNAITYTLSKFSKTKINILYAGCGPYAPLILPLLSFFKTEQISVTLLDVNKDSLNIVGAIISELDYQNYISEIITADATKYKYPKNKSLHLIITETMFHALTKEPQVAITNNLAPQLIKGGVLVPEEIKVSLGYSFFSKEPYLNQYGDEYYISNTEKETKRRIIQPLFNISKKDNKDISKNQSFYFESPWQSIPENYEETPDICIYTQIKVFDRTTLENEDSLITNPYCIGSLHNITERSKFKIKYNIKNIPKWEISTI
ncbi:hypothetical protein [Aquimarina sp. SS2-1]|uniref:hypothetical protein n=1 Tax=Aquimarina besae TaxID=3342247 RepID=UPI0036718A74